MFDLASVRARLAGTRFPNVRYAAETESTNDDAAACLGVASSAGEVFVAGFQRAGRGQRGRRWFAPPGAALMFTAILPEPLATETLWAVPFWCALGVADGIEAATGIRVGLQWPNDLLLGERKCCGILGVSRVDGDVAYVGCGVGLNVDRPPHDDDLAAIEPPPGFLSDAFARAAREDLLVEILRAFDRRYRTLASPRAIASAWDARAGIAGTRYRLAAGDEAEPFEGVARGLGEDGALVIEQDGRERRFAIGDARVLR